MRVLLILFLLLQLSAQAYTVPDIRTCIPSSENCEAYSCTESALQCGNHGYLINFGKKYCERYLKYQNLSTFNLQSWYPRVRYCLQEKLSQITNQIYSNVSYSQSYSKNEESCSELEDLAFQSHIECYVQTGYCNLNVIDKIEIAAVAGEVLFSAKSLLVEKEVEKACLLIGN